MKISKSRLLLVEGHDEKDFCEALLKHLSLSEIVQVECFQDANSGNNNLQITLQNVINDTNFEELERLGIIRDSEFTDGSLQSTQADITKANQIRAAYSLPIPQTEFNLIDGPPVVGILILPGYGVEGMFENVLLEAYEDDPAMKCVDSYIQCLEEQNFTLIHERHAKSRMRVFLVSKMLSFEESKTDNWLKNIYHREWWSWDKPAFQRIIQFVKLVADA